MEKHSFVMMIDDDQSILNIVSRILELEGRTDASSDVREILSRLEESKPNLVILDIEMPDIDNPELTETLRKDSSTPVIMLTTRCDVTTLGNALCACTGRYSRAPSPSSELAATMLSRLKAIAPDNIPSN